MSVAESVWYAISNSAKPDTYCGLSTFLLPIEVSLEEAELFTSSQNAFRGLKALNEGMPEIGFDRVVEVKVTRLVVGEAKTEEPAN